MQVIATAGHVDHGKSALVRALTGMEPDRWAEERRRGLTIDLGFAWTTLPTGERVALVDVPGHERFVGNMLAGLGPVPAVLFVVAADEGWQPQSTEHLSAVDALDVRHGLLAITKTDLANPEPARIAALERLATTSLRSVPSVAVSARSGAGLDRLRHELAALLGRLPDPDPGADVRLWVDRSFTVKGAGTVVTGTLGAGSLRVTEHLLTPTGQRLSVRGLQTLGRDRAEVAAVARVAVNLRGAQPADVPRGTALLTPGGWQLTNQIDVHLNQADWRPRQTIFHIGSAAVPVRARSLDAGYVRLTLRDPLPLRVGDRALLRHPSQRRISGVLVLDVRPAELTRRGAARARARELSVIRADPAVLGAVAQMQRHGFLRATALRGMGLNAVGVPIGNDWLVDSAHWNSLVHRARAEAASWATARPLSPQLPVNVLRQRLEIPSSVPITELLRSAGLEMIDGVVSSPATANRLPAAVEEALLVLVRRFATSPFQAPTSQMLASIGLTPAKIAAAVRAGRLLQLSNGVVLLPDALERAERVVSALDQPFTASQARVALDTSRRVAVPLLERLDRLGVTHRLTDNSRFVRTGKRSRAAETRRRSDGPGPGSR